MKFSDAYTPLIILGWFKKCLLDNPWLISNILFNSGQLFADSAVSALFPAQI
jgi:hypothetical protein